MVAVHGNVSDLHLTVLSYPSLRDGDTEAITTLNEALHREGAVAICDIPNYEDLRGALLEDSIAFSQLPLSEKNKVGAAKEFINPWDYLGYNAEGAEQFKGVVELSKACFYAIYPDDPHNKWPEGSRLRESYLAFSKTILEVGEIIMQHIGMLGEGMPIPTLEGAEHVGRLLHYTECQDGDPNPYWCGPHVDHGLITGLMLPHYRLNGKAVEAPPGAGLQIKVDGVFRRVVAPEGSLIYQIGDFGQLITNDRVIATEHRVDKPNPPVKGLERHTFAQFVDARLTDVVNGSTSVLTQDPRYIEGDTTFNDWHLRTIQGFQTK